MDDPEARSDCSREQRRSSRRLQLDRDLIRFVEALAVADARRDHLASNRAIPASGMAEDEAKRIGGDDAE